MPDRFAAAASTAEALLADMAAAADAASATAAFEAGFHRVPAFASAALLETAAGLYRAARRTDGATLLAELAAQMSAGRSGERPRAAAPGDDAEAVLGSRTPAAALLRWLERLDAEQAPQRAACLFETVSAHMPPIAEYWVHYRMSLVYAALGRPERAFLLASLALQLEPLAASSHRPAGIVASWLVAHGHWPDLARLLGRWNAAHPGLPLLGPADAALAEAHIGLLPPLQAAAGRHDRVLVPESVRPAMTIGVYGRGLPRALTGLLRPQPRPAIVLSELEDACVLIADGAVGVWSADDTPQPALSVGMPPGLLRSTLHERVRAGETLEEHELDQAVLISDMFPAPNLCHVLLDQAPRLALYAAAGIDLGAAVVIGPDPAHVWQREIARRFGARRYLGTAGLGRVRVGRMAVLSSCHDLRHAADLGAEWALAAVRAAFADLIRTPLAPRQLLISRADAAGRQLANEDAVAALLKAHGFQRIVPGLLPLSEQVRAFAAATLVVAPHGAALANLAFCAPDTRVLEIFHPHYGTSAYAMLAPSLRMRYAAMVGYDAISDAAEANDPDLAPIHSDHAFASNIRVDLDQLQAWLRADS